MRLLLWQQFRFSCVPNEGKALMRRLCLAVYLRVVRICQRLDEGVPIALMLNNVVSQARHHRLVVLFYLAVGLRMVCSCCQVQSSKKAAHRGGELVCKLRSSVSLQEL